MPAKGREDGRLGTGGDRVEVAHQIPDELRVVAEEVRVRKHLRRVLEGLEIMQDEALLQRLPVDGKRCGVVPSGLFRLDDGLRRVVPEASAYSIPAP